jgi:hypothetical protein
VERRCKEEIEWSLGEWSGDGDLVRRRKKKRTRA